LAEDIKYITTVKFFKSISLFFLYRSIIKSITKELEIEYNARVDNISRIYTVLNLPQEIFEEPYNIRRTDIDTISRTYISEYRDKISKFLISRGLLELYKLYEIRKVDKFSYLLIFGYSLFDTKKVVNWIITIVITFISILLIYLLFRSLITTLF